MKHFAVGLLILSLFCAAANAHNITKILAAFPEYSTFNSYLTQTKLADDINSRTTITVLVVDNGAMSALTGKKLGLSAIKRVLSLHVVLDYFDPNKLHQITNGTTLSTTLYQTTGSAPGNTGFLNITDLKGGKVGFGPAARGSKLDTTYVKSVKEMPFNISVLQVSQIIMPSAVEAPSPSPSQVNITALLLKVGYKQFVSLITSTGVLKTYEDAVEGGLTLFAPSDAAFIALKPKLDKLSSAQKVSILQYHALPVYSPLGTLKTTNGPISTLATNGASKFALTVSSSGDTVMLSTGVDKATITGTLLDDQPLAIFSVDKVFQPKEIFTAAPTPAPASTPSEAPSPAAESPETTSPSTSPSPSSSSSASSPPAPAGPAEGPAGSSAEKDTSFASANNVARGLLASLGALACGVVML
eukprot:Gb_05461 [translate_table: standard]